MARDRKQLGAGVVRAAKACKPIRTSAQNGRNDRDGFHVVHGGRTAIKTRTRRERRLHAGHALFAFQAFDQRGFFTTDIRACTVMQENVEIPTGPRCVATQKTVVIGFINRGLQRFTLADVFAAQIDVAGVRIHRERSDQRALDQRMRIVTHDFAVFTGARLGFISVDDEIRGTTVALLGHEGPLQTRREARTAAAAQTRVFHGLDDPVPPFFDEACGAIPMAALFGACQRALMHPIKVGKDPVLVLQHVCLPLAVLAHPPELKNVDPCIDKAGKRGKIEQ